MIDNANIIYNSKNGIEYIQFKKLMELGIRHAYTLKGENINFRSKLLLNFWKKCALKVIFVFKILINFMEIVQACLERVP